MTAAAEVLTLGDVARELGLPLWKIRRLYERGLLPAPRRAGLYRIVARADLAAIEQALRQAGTVRPAGVAHAP